MDWFAMSAKFYMDLDDKGVSEQAQTFLVRACAYMALNETGGFLPASAVSKLGLRAAKRRIDELEQRGIVVRNAHEVEHESSTKCDTIRERSETPTGYVFPAWKRWNAPLEAQVRKKKADRARVAEKRDVARQSRLTRAGTQNSNKTEEYVGTAAVRTERASAQSPAETFADGTPIPPEPGTVVQLRRDGGGPAPSRAANSLAAMHCPPGTPGRQIRDLAVVVQELLDDPGVQRVDLEAALGAWRDRPGAGARLLPSLVTDAAKARAGGVPGRASPMRGSEAIDAGHEAARILAAAQQPTAAKELE